MKMASRKQNGLYIPLTAGLGAYPQVANQISNVSPPVQIAEAEEHELLLAAMQSSTEAEIEPIKGPNSKDCLTWTFGHNGQHMNKHHYILIFFVVASITTMFLSTIILAVHYGSIVSTRSNKVATAGFALLFISFLLNVMYIVYAIAYTMLVTIMTVRKTSRPWTLALRTHLRSHFGAALTLLVFNTIAFTLFAVHASQGNRFDEWDSDTKASLVIGLLFYSFFMIFFAGIVLSQNQQIMHFLHARMERSQKKKIDREDNNNTNDYSNSNSNSVSNSNALM